MAKILEFRPTEFDCEQRSRPVCEGQTGEVIVFPGVRYERQAESMHSDPVVLDDEPERRRRRRRDRLELMD